jgi:hypothetical protein
MCMVKGCGSPAAGRLRRIPLCLRHVVKVQRELDKLGLNVKRASPEQVQEIVSAAGAEVCGRKAAGQ